ncbi:MAG: radical SAM protein [Bacteroidetes bacterium HGW-Bacteroidetes-14]|nr:MAG: radical SAM protein [Bacteroidetes bacterium HGW-Bacteroidetes-14]
MLCDTTGRTLTYLRISVTDRCNLRCNYCMPEEGVPLVEHSRILSFDEIVNFTRIAVSKGITKVRLTGGEPLVRRGITELVRSIAAIEGIKDLSMTTNGQLLSLYAKELKEAGLNRINISLDATDPGKYREITRGGDVTKVFEGIRAASEAGLDPVKINCVVKHNREEKDARDVAAFASENGLQVRYIQMMDLHRGDFGIVDGGDGGDCPRCNRLRLTATGMVKPCLFSDLEFDVRELGAEMAINLAVKQKPLRGGHNTTGEFFNIGG